MAEYIDRGAAIAAIMSEPSDAHYPQWYADKIKSIPTADVAQVRHGLWEDIYHGKYANPRFRCSACNAKALYVNVLNGLGNWIDEQELSNYCPNCGAKMDGDMENYRQAEVIR